MTKKRQPPEPIALTILTGFLGSGKTTLLNWVLKNEAFSNAVVLINEFGDVGLDHLFVETADEQMIEMSSGCLCCTIRGDLCDTLEKLLRDRDNDRIKKFDRVIIETTGLADPAPVIQTLIAHPYFMMRFRLNALVTTVDAQHGIDTLDRHEEAVKQVAMADVLVTTKTDLESIGEADIEALNDRLDGLNKIARRVHPREEILLETLLSDRTYKPDRENPDIENWLFGEMDMSLDEDHAHHHHDDDSSHDVNRHSETIRSFSFTYDRAIGQQQYDHFLELLRAKFGTQLLRYKAMVNIKEHEDRPVISHGVQHVFYPSEILENWPVDDRLTRIVCITDGVEKDQIEDLFRTFAGEMNQYYQTQIGEGENPLSLGQEDGLFEGGVK